MDDVGLGESLVRGADLAVQFQQDVVYRIVDERVGAGVQLRGAVGHRLFGVEHRRQQLVVDDDLAAALLGGTDRVGEDGNHPLTNEPHHVVENVGVIGIDEMIGVDGGGVKLARHIFPRVDAMDTGYGQRGGGVDGHDARVRVRGVQHLQVQHPVDLGVHGELRTPGDHGGARRCSDADADGLPGSRLFNTGDTVDRVLNGPIAGAATEVSLQCVRQVPFLFVGQSGRGHDHPGRAEPALESRCVAELPLHRVQVVGRAETLDGGDLPALGTECRGDATVHRPAVQPDGARPAVAGIAALLHPVAAQGAQEGAQALARTWFALDGFAVDGIGHHRPPVASSSSRISSA